MLYIHNRKHASQIHRGGLCLSNNQTQTDFHHSRRKRDGRFSIHEQTWPCSHESASIDTELVNLIAGRRIVQSKAQFARWKVHRFEPISQWNPRLKTTITSHDRFHRFIRLESFCNEASLKRYNLLSSNVQNDHFTKVCKYSCECTRSKEKRGV